MPPITTIAQAEPWLDIFAADIIARLEVLGGQRPRTIAVHVQVNGPRHPGRSKQGPVPLGAKLDVHTVSRLSLDLLVALEREGATWPLVTLSVDVSNLEETTKAKTPISSLLAMQGQVKANTSSSLAESQSNAPESDTQPAQLRGGKAAARKRTLFDFQGFSNDDENGMSSRCDMAKRSRNSVDRFVDDKTDANPGPIESVLCEKSVSPEQDLTLVADETRPHDPGINLSSYLCELCHKAIAEADVLEHLDWHAAMELHERG